MSYLTLRKSTYLIGLLFLISFILIAIPCVSAQEDPLAQKQSKETTLDVPDNLFSKKVDPESVIKKYAPHATSDQIKKALADPDSQNRAGLLIGALGGQLTHDARMKLANEPDLQPEALRQYHWIKKNPQIYTKLKQYQTQHPRATIQDMRQALETGEISQVDVTKQTLKGLTKDPAKAIRQMTPTATDDDIQKALENLSKQRTTGALHEVFPDLTSGQLLQLLEHPALSKSSVEAHLLAKKRPQLTERIENYKKAHPGATDAQIQQLIESGKLNTVEIPDEILSGMSKKSTDPVKAIQSTIPNATEAKIKMALSAPDFEAQQARWMKIFPTATQDQIAQLLQAPALQPAAIKQYKWEKSHPTLTSQINAIRKKYPEADNVQIRKYLEEKRVESQRPKTPPQSQNQDEHQVRPKAE